MLNQGVSKTLPLDMMLSQGLGMAFSLARGEKEEGERTLFASRYFTVGLTFHAVVAFGVALACYLLYPDWMMMYFADSREVPKGVVTYIFSGYFAMYTLGFLMVPPMRRVKKELPWVVFAGLLGLVFGFIFLTFHRLWYVGSYQEYKDDEALPIHKTGLFPILLISMPAAVVGLIALVAKLNKSLEE